MAIWTIWLALKTWLKLFFKYAGWFIQFKTFRILIAQFNEYNTRLNEENAKYEEKIS